MSLLLALDCGNTRLKWGLHDGQRWVQFGHSAHDPATMQTELCAAPNRVILSNVSRALSESECLQPFNHLPQYIVRAMPAQCGVINTYQQADQLGSDRWAALIAAHHLGASTAVIINAGTALTVDALHQGQFLGGNICPGYQTMQTALSQKTNLPESEQSLTQSIFPVNTEAAISRGCIDAMLGSVHRITQDLAQHAGTRPSIWLSGGDAPRLAPFLNARIETHLVLQGLYLIAQESFK